MINTIVNHAEKLKLVESKTNYIVNNFANSSHAREIVEKTKEIEKHVFGAPRPHSSWREFVLVLLCIMIALVALHQIFKRLVLPYVVEYLNVKTQHQKKWINTISEQIEDANGNKLNSEREDKWKDLITKVEQLERKLNAREPTTNNFLGYKEQGKE